MCDHGRSDVDVSVCSSRLHVAVRENDASTVEQLLREGVDPDEPDWTHSGDAPILQASASGNLSVVRALCARGCDLKVRTARGETALHLAVTSRRGIDATLSLIKTLLEAGCDANIQENLERRTALHVLARQLHSRSDLLDCFYVLAPVTDVNLRDHRMRTPLHKLAGSGCSNVEPYQALLKCGTDPSLKNDRGETALHEALERDSFNAEDVAILLIEAGTDLSIQNIYGETTLHIASRRNFYKISESLLNHNAPTDLRDLHGNTPLHLAAGKGYSNIVSMILKKQGPELNFQNKEGLTPLHIAVESGFMQVVKLLLGTGNCDLSVKTRLSFTPLDLAHQEYRRRSQPEMSDVLTKEIEKRCSPENGISDRSMCQ